MRTASGLVVMWLFTSGVAFAQSTVYVAPVPQVGDPNYVSFQLQQLGQTLQRNQMNTAQLEILRVQSETNRALLELVKREELQSLVALAQLLESAGTEEQKLALRTLIQQKLDSLLPANVRSFPAGTTLVISTPGFPWAAEQVAGVLGGHPAAVELGVGDANRALADNPNVAGLVEVDVNVYQTFETVQAICRNKTKGVAWTKKVVLNAGGGPETLARNMVGKLVRKLRGLTCP